MQECLEEYAICSITHMFYWQKFQEDLAKMGVMIRHYDKKELKGYIRISVGKPEHTDALMKGLNALRLWELLHIITSM